MANKIIMTDGTRSQTLYRMKYKGLNPYTDETPGVWSPDPSDTAKQAKSMRLVPSVFAGIHARMQAMMDLPFVIYGKGDKVVDDSDSYKNVIGFLPDPIRYLGLTEASLVTNGRAYWFRANGSVTGSTKELRYWLPSSVELDQENAKNYIIKFRRKGAAQLYNEQDVLYNWLYDENVEIGPPSIYPLLSALTAAEANGAITKWVRDYMNRGAIKAMLLMLDGVPPPGEVERIENWWNRFMTGLRGLRWKVFQGQNVKPTIVGDGLEALKDLSITKELRYEVHQALGTRHLLEDENFATASARERQFYTITILPDARLIQSSMNTQALEPMGYHWEFQPDRLEIFQTSEEDKAQQYRTASLNTLYTVLSGALSSDTALPLAMDILEYELTDEQQALFDKGVKAKADAATKIAEQTKQQPPADQNPPEQKTPPQPVLRALVELNHWEAKVKKAGKMVTWHAVDLPVEMVKSISDGALSFADARLQLSDKPNDKSEVWALLEGIRLALPYVKE